jgi:CSLREA domain-containing protein
MISMKTQRETKYKAPAFGFLLAAALMAACVLLAAVPAHAATFTVNSTDDLGDQSPGDGSCWTGVFIQVGPRFVRECTLRAAIQETNANNNDATVVDAINFSIPTTDPKCNANTNVCTISPASHLPTITEAVTIDGYSQPGASENTRANGNNAVLLIQLNGANSGENASGLILQTSNSVVKGLVINRFAIDGIHIFRGTNNTVEGNFIGTDPSGTLDRGNGSFGGVFVYGSNNTTGGATRDKRNVISGNGGTGVRLYFGNGNRVQGNYIGTKKDGTSPLGNDTSGVAMVDAANNTIGGISGPEANVIAFNGGAGVVLKHLSTGVAGTFGNAILRNSIFSNTGLGIDLNGDGRTANDPGDADPGENNLQNFPVITSAETPFFDGPTTIKGRLNSTLATTFTVQFFSNPSNDNEGKKFIGQKTNVVTDSSGNASFTFSPNQRVALGQRITATATDPNANTSEFSDAREVTRGGVIGGTAS